MVTSRMQLGDRHSSKSLLVISSNRLEALIRRLFPLLKLDLPVQKLQEVDVKRSPSLCISSSRSLVSRDMAPTGGGGGRPRDPDELEEGG